MTTKPPEAAPTEPSARQLAHEHEGSMCSEQAHSVDCDHWTRVVTARDRQHEAALAASRADAELWKTGRDVADAHRRELATDLDRARSRLGEAVGLLTEAEDLLSDWWNSQDGTGYGPLVGVVDDTKALVPKLRSFLASPESAAPPKEPADGR